MAVVKEGYTENSPCLASTAKVVEEYVKRKGYAAGEIVSTGQIMFRCWYEDPGTPLELLEDGNAVPMPQLIALAICEQISRELLNKREDHNQCSPPWLQKEHADMVQRPNHYLKNGYECWDTIAVIISDLPPVEAYNVGNIIKYLWRYPKKNGLEDLKKARQYLDRLIMEVEINDFGKDE